MSHKMTAKSNPPDSSKNTEEPRVPEPDKTDITDEEWTKLESVCGLSKWYFLIELIHANGNKPTPLKELNDQSFSRLGTSYALGRTRYPAQTLGAPTINNLLVKQKINLRIKHVGVIKGKPYEGSLQIHRGEFQARFSSRMREKQKSLGSELLLP